VATLTTAGSHAGWRRCRQSLAPVRRQVGRAGQVGLAALTGDVLELDDRQPGARGGQPSVQPLGQIGADEAVRVEAGGHPRQIGRAFVAPCSEPLGRRAGGLRALVEVGGGGPAVDRR
jgi:hypothetical protein